MTQSKAGVGIVKTVESVIVVSDSAVIDGGAAKVAIETARIMCDAGLNVTMFTGGTLIEPGPKDFRVHVTGDDAVAAGRPSISRFARGVWNRNAKQRLDAVLEQHDPDSTVVHVHSWGSKLSPSVFASVRKRNYATVITAHDYLLGCPNSCRYVFPTAASCERTPASPACIMKRCDRTSYAAKIFRLFRYIAQTLALRGLQPTVVYVSEYQRQKGDHFTRFEHQTLVVRNPLEVQSRTSEYSGADGPYLCVARLEKEKGVDVFCDALKAAGFGGRVLGDGSEREFLATRYPEVQFYGWTQQEQTYQGMLTARALVFPSRWLEAAPLTPLEAQLVAALPCVVSDACAAQDMISDGVTGLIFRSGDPEDLARCLRKLQDPDYHGRLRKNIIDSMPEVRKRYAAADYTVSLLQIYNAALAK